MSAVRNVLVSGAGIAGLSAAISLARTGISVTVVERLTSLAAGASITLVNRGPDALRDLGVLEACMDESFHAKGRSLYDDVFDAGGNKIAIPPIPVRSDDLPSYVLIFRPILARILGDKARAHGATIEFGRGIDSLSDDGEAVTATFSDGGSQTFDLVVAADGTSSATRESLFPGRITPEYSGNMSLRWVKGGLPEGPGGFYSTDHSHTVVVHPLHEDLLYIATGVDMENRRVSASEGVELLRKALSMLDAPYVRQLLSHVDDADEVIVRPYCTHLLPTPWHKGRIVLIGDAVHTMSAHIASGGVMSMEDGLVLGDELAKGDDLDTTLRRFALRRYPRAFVAVDSCRKMLDLQVRQRAHPGELSKVREQAFAALLKPY